MAAVPVLSDFWARENKICHCVHFFPFCLSWSDGTGCHDLSVLNVEFQAKFFTLIKRLFISSLLSAIRVVSSAYLGLLIFLPAILIPACASSIPAFLMMYSAYKLNISHSVLSDYLWSHELQHARLPCLSPTPKACSNSCPLSWWCHSTISSSVVP